MIDEKKLIEVLKNHVDHIKEALGDGLHLVDLEMAYDEFIDIVKAQPKTGEWIPVSERLPEEEGVYLRTCESVVEMVAFDPNEEFDVEEWQSTVNAWMPLPEPWEGEK